MLRGENFIYFFTVVGFFIGIIFAILNAFEPEKFLYSVILISSIFYIVGVASSGFFIKFLSVKKAFDLDKETLEATIDMQIYELDKKEEFIREAHYFIEEIENEEKAIYNKDNK